MAVVLHGRPRTETAAAVFLPPPYCPAGRKMAEFPVDPMLAKMIIQSQKYGVSGAPHS